MKKKFLALATLAVAALCFSFEWPAKEFEGEVFVPTFAQNKNGRFNASQIFSGANEALATDKGKVVAVIFESQGFGWFESTLGNCVIISHEDGLISIYGNLDKKSAENFSTKEQVFSGEKIGECVNSAWSETENSLEFQIADTKEKAFLNPLILMPRSFSMPEPSLDTITLENRLGRIFEISSTRQFQAGTYSIYKKHRQSLPTNETSIYLNGMALEKIEKGTLKAQGGTLFISAERSYSSKDFYPDDERELLGRIVIPHGTNTLEISARNALGNEKKVTYSIQGF